MAEYVDLSERVTATYYNDEYEEWTQKTVTIADVLDSVCDDYTVLPSAQPTYTDEQIQKMQDLEQAELEKAFELGREEGRKEAQPKKGKWIKLYAGNYKCSVCGDWWGNDDNEMVEDFKYCPNCGADMRPDNAPLADDDSIYG